MIQQEAIEGAIRVPSFVSSTFRSQIDMYKQVGRFKTQNASRYLGQLCKHFAHKVDVEYDANKGTVAFPFGAATLHASDDLLSVCLTGPSDEALARARSVVDVHLKTFAFREEFERMDWQDVDESV